MKISQAHQVHQYYIYVYIKDAKREIRKSCTTGWDMLTYVGQLSNSWKSGEVGNLAGFSTFYLLFQVRKTHQRKYVRDMRIQWAEVESCLHRYSDQQSASSSIKMAFRTVLRWWGSWVWEDEGCYISNGTCDGAFDGQNTLRLRESRFWK